MLEGFDICDLNNWKVSPCCEGGGGPAGSPCQRPCQIDKCVIWCTVKMLTLAGRDLSRAWNTGYTICSLWKCHLEPILRAQARPETCPSTERTCVFGEMPGSGLVSTNLGLPEDFGELLLSGVVWGSNKSPAWALLHIPGLLKSWLSANVFIMCRLCDRLGWESRLFNALCFSSNKVLSEILTLIQPGWCLRGGADCDRGPAVHQACCAHGQLWGSPAPHRGEGRSGA